MMQTDKAFVGVPLMWWTVQQSSTLHSPPVQWDAYCCSASPDMLYNLVNTVTRM